MTELRERLSTYILSRPEGSLAQTMVESGFEPGYPAALYYPFIKDALSGDNIDEVAEGLLSVFYFSIDLYDKPLQAFKHYSDILFSSSKKTLEVEAVLMKLVEQFNQYYKAHHDSKRVSPV